MSKSFSLAFLSLVVSLILSLDASAAQTAEQRSLNELRNTVINLLQGLVERGVLTREQAEAMVATAQQRAAQDAAAAAEQEQAEAGAIRVPYIPEVVKEQIRTEVTRELGDTVAQQVIEQAKNEQWGVPAALPDWVKRVRFSGDLRVRGQGDVFSADNFVLDAAGNATNLYIPDFVAANDRGGIARAGTAGFANVSEDRERLRARLRLGMDVELGGGFSLAARLATGNLRDPVSTNQTLGNYAARYTVGIDQAYARWFGQSRESTQLLTLTAGRMPNPWYSTDLVWDSDLTFEGVTANYRLGLKRDEIATRFVYATVGAFPLEEIEVERDKWLLGAQAGIEWRLETGSRLRLGLAYYDFRNTRGRINSFGSTLLDFTAPRFLVRGNTLVDIRNDNDTTTNLFALAADYRLANVTFGYDWRLSPQFRLTLSGDYVRNIAYDEDEVRARGGQLLVFGAAGERNEGYQGEIGLTSGSGQTQRAWRAFLGYRYVQRDAVIDAFTDSDFRLGGTDVRGFYVGGEWSLSPRVSILGRYLSGDEIDGPPLGIDVWQLDLNTRF